MSKAVPTTDQKMSESTAQDLEWIPSEVYVQEDEGFAKIIRKCKEDPIVPIGTLATCGALGYGLIAFKNSNTMMSQYMMRTRIVAQGVTVAAIVFSLIASSKKQQSKYKEIAAEKAKKGNFS